MLLAQVVHDSFRLLPQVVVRRRRWLLPQNGRFLSTLLMENNKINVILR
jgi:hypothetical protein